MNPFLARDYAAWLAVAALFALVAACGWFMPHALIDWQPELLTHEPWRALTPIGVHYSRAHLIGNLAGVGLAGLFGVAAMVPRRLAWAWLAAWPLTHLGLLLRPELRHYGGLSGVVHAGVAAIVVWLFASARTPAQRAVAALVAIGLIAKVLSESPWGEVLRHSAGWDIAVAPLVHATGAVAGALCALVAVLGQRDIPNPGADRLSR